MWKITMKVHKKSFFETFVTAEVVMVIALFLPRPGMCDISDKFMLTSPQANNGSLSLLVGSSAEMVCTIQPYKGYMRWMDDTKTLAEYVKTFCTLMDIVGGCLQFGYNTQEGIFTVVFRPNTTGKKVFRCDNGEKTLNITAVINEINPEMTTTTTYKFHVLLVCLVIFASLIHSVCVIWAIRKYLKSKNKKKMGFNNSQATVEINTPGSPRKCSPTGISSDRKPKVDENNSEAEILLDDQNQLESKPTVRSP